MNGKTLLSFPDWLSLRRPICSNSNKKLSCCRDADRTAYDYGILANYQTGFGYTFTNGWYNAKGRVYEVMNASKLSTQA